MRHLRWMNDATAMLTRRRFINGATVLGGYGVGPEMDRCLRELALARALYVCGDFEGLGRRTLEAYAKDPRGVLSEHANAVLAAGISPSADVNTRNTRKTKNEQRKTKNEQKKAIVFGGGMCGNGVCACCCR